MRTILLFGLVICALFLPSCESTTNNADEGDTIPAGNGETDTIVVQEMIKDEPADTPASDAAEEQTAPPDDGESSDMSVPDLILEEHNSNRMDEAVWRQMYRLRQFEDFPPQDHQIVQKALALENQLTDAKIIESYALDGWVFYFYGDDMQEAQYLAAGNLDNPQQFHFFDLKKYFRPEGFEKGDSAFVTMPLRYAAVRDSILYFSNFHRTYAASSKGENAFITAINLNNYNVLWRSQSLVCNSNEFILLEDVIICGYGFTREDDWLYVINRYSGAVLQRKRINSMAQHLDKKKDKLFVLTYGGGYVFRLQY